MDLNGYVLESTRLLATRQEKRQRNEAECYGFHRGILPCFLRGIVSTLFSSMRSARITCGRVSRGSITSSMYPRSAATNGLAKRSRNSSIFGAGASVVGA